MKFVLVHFDVTEHFVLLDTFVSSATAVETAVNSISKFYFDGKLDFELVVLPPEPGSLKQIIGVVLKTGAVSYAILWSAIQMMDSDAVKEISKELIGKTPSELVVEKIRTVREYNLDQAAQLESIDPSDANLVEEIVADSVRTALERPRDEILRSKLPEEMKYEIELAQSELYSATLANPEVKGIGFSDDDDFPIPRNQFAERAVKPRSPKKLEEELPDWRVGITRIRVSSPNFDRSDQSGRKWKGKNTDGLTLLFEVEDEQFWQRLPQHDIEFTDSTELEVQLASRYVEGKPKEHRAIRVLTVDGKKIASPLDDEAVSAIIGSFSKTQRSPSVADFFDQS